MFKVFPSCDRAAQREATILTIAYVKVNARYSLLCNQNQNNNQKNVMYNVGLLIINKPEIYCDSYFEMYMLPYFQLLIQKVEGDTIRILTTIYKP